MDQSKGGQEHLTGEKRNDEMGQLKLVQIMDESLAKIYSHNLEVKSAIAKELVKLGLSEKGIQRLLNIEDFKKDCS